jgi:hypothetical protein
MSKFIINLITTVLASFVLAYLFIGLTNCFYWFTFQYLPYVINFTESKPVSFIPLLKFTLIESITVTPIITVVMLMMEYKSNKDK